MKRLNNRNLIFLVIALVLAIILILVYGFTKDDIFNKYKYEKGKNIVYPIYTKDKTNVPHLNLKGTTIDTINNTIVDKANDFLKGNNTITYDFEINGKVLSLAIQYIDYYADDDYLPIISYDVFNIDMNKSSLLSDEDMLSFYNITSENVSPIVEARFKEFFNELNEENHYFNECDYSCFLGLRGIKDEEYMEDIHYYIKKGNLYVIRPFKIYSSFKDEDYFSPSDFLIQITE